MKEGRKSYLLRINEELWNDINLWADQEFRSVNGQIELVLQRAVDEWKKGRKPKKTKEDTGDSDKAAMIEELLKSPNHS